MQYEAHLFRVDFDTETITHRAGFNTGKDCKPEKWAWHEVTKDDLESARQAIQRCNVNWDIFKSDSIGELRQYFSPHTGIVSLFLQWMMEYPRIQVYVRNTPSDRAEIGGVEYINADTPPPDFEESIDGALAEQEYSTGGFHTKFNAFKDYVNWVGVNFNCTRAAQTVTLAFDNIHEALCECGIDGFADLDNAIKHALNALAEMSIALADVKQQTTPNNTEIKRERKRYPQDSEALKVLREAKRRKGSKAYSGDSNEAIFKRMIEEPQSKWAKRILEGRKRGKASMNGREHFMSNPIQAAKTWGKYLSAYLKDYPLKS